MQPDETTDQDNEDGRGGVRKKPQTSDFESHLDTHSEPPERIHDCAIPWWNHSVSEPAEYRTAAELLTGGGGQCVEIWRGLSCPGGGFKEIRRIDPAADRGRVANRPRCG